MDAYSALNDFTALGYTRRVSAIAEMRRGQEVREEAEGPVRLKFEAMLADAARLVEEHECKAAKQELREVRAALADVQHEDPSHADVLAFTLSAAEKNAKRCRKIATPEPTRVSWEERLAEKHPDEQAWHRRRHERAKERRARWGEGVEELR